MIRIATLSQIRVGQATVAVVAASRRFAWPIVAAAFALTVILAIFAADRLRFNTDTSDVLSRDLPFRQANLAYRALFPAYSNPMLVVVDGTSADAVDDGARRLAARLGAAPGLFPTVFYPPGDPFFRRNGLLYLSTDRLADLSDRIAESQAFLTALARDPSLRGLFDLLRKALDEGGGELDRAGGMRTGLDALSAAIEARTAGRDEPLSWAKLIEGGKEAGPRAHVILVETAVDNASFRSAAEAMGYVRAAAADLGLTPAHGVRVRLTGEAALGSEELDSVFSGAVTASVLSLVLVALVVMIGLRSVRLVGAVMATLVAGLVFTSAFAAGAVGSLNLISAAFAVLFIGIAVDFGIHFALRYKEQALRGVAHDRALENAARRVGPSMLLAAAAALIAFFSFLPTSYRGLAELGLIAGVGMIVAVATCLTILPALLTVLPRRQATGPAVAPRAVAIESVVRRQARLVALAALALAVAAAPFAADVRFEMNPLTLLDPKLESVATLRELMRDDAAMRPAIAVVAPDLDSAQAEAKRMAGLSTVAEAVTAADFVPENQARKLEIVGEMGLFLAPLFDPEQPPAPPSAAERGAALESFLASAQRYLAAGDGAALREPVRRLATALMAFRAGPGGSGDGIAGLETALLGSLPGRLDDLREALRAQPVRLADVPATLRRQFIAPDGQARAEARPKADLIDDAALRRYVNEVTARFPRAVGPPILMTAGADAVVSAFFLASSIALGAIMVLLLAVLRSVVDAACVLAPLALAGVLTFAVSATAGPPINYANIIVLPLLLGLGVSSGIYLVTRAREEPDRSVLRTITPRAVVFSTMTTIVSFGSLIVSGHVGMASMGWLLLIAITLSLVCNIVILPALLTLRYRRTGEATKDDKAR